MPAGGDAVETDDKLLTLREVSEHMRIPVRRVRKLISDGVLVPVVRMGPRTTLVKTGIVLRIIRLLEGEGYGPTNRIARIPRRQPV